MTYHMANKNAARKSPSYLRQVWLEQAMADLRLLFERMAGEKIPREVRVSVGFPKGSRGGGGHSIGQCWFASCSEDYHNELFISPTIADSLKVLATLAHELVHAVKGPEAGHKHPFKQVALRIGLEGKMTATTAGPFFEKWADDFISVHGKYPGAKLSTEGMKKQSTRLIKCECAGCGYVARVTRKWIRSDGAPVCPSCEEAMSYELGEAPEADPMWEEGDDDG